MRVLILSQAILLLSCLLINGCSPLKERVDAKGVPVSVKSDPVAETRTRVESALRKDQPYKAKAELLKGRQEGITESSLQDQFVAVEAYLLNKAGTAEETQSFDRAGELYRMAMDVYPETTEVAAALALSRDEINAKLSLCADELMKRGLMSYRDGNLLAAVQTWKQISVFMPDHSPSAVAIETAEQQIANLEKLTPLQNN